MKEIPEAFEVMLGLRFEGLVGIWNLKLMGCYYVPSSTTTTTTITTTSTSTTTTTTTTTTITTITTNRNNNANNNNANNNYYYYYYYYYTMTITTTIISINIIKMLLRLHQPRLRQHSKHTGRTASNRTKTIAKSNRTETTTFRKSQNRSQIEPKRNDNFSKITEPK